MRFIEIWFDFYGILELEKCSNSFPKIAEI